MVDKGIVFSLRGYDINEYEYQSGKDNKTVTVYRITGQRKDFTIVNPSKPYTGLQEAVYEVLLRAFEEVLDAHDNKLLNLKEQVKGLERRINKTKELETLEKRLSVIREEIEDLREVADDISREG